MSDLWEAFHFADPAWALGVLVLPLIYWIKKKLNYERATVFFPTISQLKRSLKSTLQSMDCDCPEYFEALH